MQQKLNRNLENAYSDGAHFLLRLYYVSQASDSLTSQEVKNILSAARANNQKNGITGALIFNKKYFLQVVEGSRPAINDLMNALAADGRHHNLQVIRAHQVAERYWSDWDMNYFSPSVANTKTFMRFSPTPHFNPYMMSAGAIESIFRYMSEGGAIGHDLHDETESEQHKGRVFSLLNFRGGK